MAVGHVSVCAAAAAYVSLKEGEGPDLGTQSEELCSEWLQPCGRGWGGIGESGEREAAWSVRATGHKLAEERPAKEKRGLPGRAAVGTAGGEGGGGKQSSEGFSAAERLGETKTRWASPWVGVVSVEQRAEGQGAVREP